MSKAIERSSSGSSLASDILWPRPNLKGGLKLNSALLFSFRKSLLERQGRKCIPAPLCFFYFYSFLLKHPAILSSFTTKKLNRYVAAEISQRPSLNTKLS